MSKSLFRLFQAVWNVEGVYVKSRHIPGIRFAGFILHPGLMGTIPSQELLDIWNSHEFFLVSKEGTETETTLCRCLATRPLSCLFKTKRSDAWKTWSCHEKKVV